MDRVLTLGFIQSADPRLGRHINHDSISRLYRVSPKNVEIKDVRHQRYISVFDQGNLGDCVPNAANGLRGTGPHFKHVKTETKFPLNDNGNKELYRAVTRTDPYPGAWEPDDTGSDGLSVAKVLTDSGDIPGYLHAFSLNDVLQTLMNLPMITGVYWYSDMFNPSPEGLVTPTGSIAGGHEFVVDEYRSDRGWIGFTNSWSANWGVRGRFYMEAEKYGDLLAKDGDATSFLLPVEPAPVPQPTPDEDFAKILKPWVKKRHIGENGRVSRAASNWLKQHNFS